MRLRLYAVLVRVTLRYRSACESEAVDRRRVGVRTRGGDQRAARRARRGAGLCTLVFFVRRLVAFFAVFGVGGRGCRLDARSLKAGTYRVPFMSRPAAFAPPRGRARARSAVVWRVAGRVACRVSIRR